MRELLWELEREAEYLQYEINRLGDALPYDAYEFMQQTDHLYNRLQEIEEQLEVAYEEIYTSPHYMNCYRYERVMH